MILESMMAWTWEHNGQVQVVYIECLLNADV